MQQVWSAAVFVLPWLCHCGKPRLGRLAHPSSLWGASVPKPEPEPAPPQKTALTTASATPRVTESEPSGTPEVAAARLL